MDFAKLSNAMDVNGLNFWKVGAGDVALIGCAGGALEIRAPSLARKERDASRTWRL